MRKRMWCRSCALALAVASCLCLISWMSLATCTTGWVAPADNDSHEGMSWSNGGGGETAYDDEWAYTSVNGDEHEYDNYGFTLGGTIPATAVITGFEVRIRGYSEGSTGSVQVALSHDGGGQIDKQAATMPWVISLPIGASNEAWGSVWIDNPPFIHTFTPAEVCGGNDTFTVWVKANVGGTAVYVDAVEVRVTYYNELIAPFTPNNPTPSSSSHATGTWYNASTLPDSMVTIDWTSATDRPTCDSGIDGYRVYWDANSSTNLGASDGYYFDESGAHTQDFSQGSGSYWFHIRSVDNVGNLADSTAHLGPFQYDDTWPTNPNVTSSKSIGWSNTATVPIQISGATDSPSGVDGFAMAWDHSATWTPDNAKDREETWTGETFTMAADGVWYFHLSTVDNAGNWTASSVYETEGWFGVDTHAPSDPAVTSPTHAEGSLSSNPNVQIAVAGASDTAYGQTGYEVNSGVDGFSVVWDHDPSGVPDAVKDQEENWTGTTTTLADGTWYYHLRTADNAGNWTSTEDYGPVTIDTDPPGVSSVVASPTVVSDADVGSGTFTVTVDFDEAMDTGVSPALGFAPSVSSTLSLAGGSWVDSDTFRATYNVADANTDVDSVTIDVTGAEDAAGNGQEDYTPESEFAIDTLNPTVSGVSAGDTLLTDSDAGGTFTVTIDFSEDMETDGSADPSLTFNPSVGSTLSSTGGSWSDSDTYQATYNISDANVDENSVTIDVAGACDAAGNGQQNYAPQSEFEIDTRNPWVTNVAVDDTLLSDSDVGTTLVVTVDFSEPMTSDGSADPGLTFNPALATTLSFSSDLWPTGLRYRAIYDVLDGGVDHDSVTIDAAGAQDANQNPQQDYTPAHELEVDTLNPTVIQVTLSDNEITDANVGGTFTVTIDYSEAMMTTAPSIAFFPNLDTTLAFQSGTSGWTDGDTYVARYAVLDGGVTVLGDDVAVSGAQDLSGNVQVPFNYDDHLNVDTENPYIHSFSVVGGAVDDACERVVTFSAKVTDPNGTMNPGDASVVSATVTNATIGAVYDIQQTSDDAATITITGKVDVSNLTACPARVTITLDADDSVGNQATQQQSQADDVVDTTIPVIHTLRLDEHVVVDGCCEAVVTFDAYVEDNCCVSPDGILISVTNPTGNAVVDFTQAADVTFTQNGQSRVDLAGEITVRCLTSCPAYVVVTVDATDCCGNRAATVVSEPDPTDIAYSGGDLYDEGQPGPRDDPRQDLYETGRPDLEVRVDDFGVFRLVMREDTPDRIDVLWNDDDNCTGKSCSGSCCGTIRIESITDPPMYGTATVEVWEGTCDTTPQIRYAPDTGYLGPDQFKYRTVDRCSNISLEVTVYLQVIPEVWMEDVSVIACANEPTAFAISATDLWVDPIDPTAIPFAFSILDGPGHGVVIGDLAEIFYTPSSEIPDPTGGAGLVPSLDFMERAAVELIYVPSAGFIGRDQVRFEFSDPFGGYSTAVADILVGDCDGSGAIVEIRSGEMLRLLVPLSFQAILDGSWSDVGLQFLEDGVLYPEAISALWDEDVGRYMLLLDSTGLAPGAYRLELPLGNGETVVLTIEVGGESE